MRRRVLGLRVRIKAGDGGEALNKAILSKDAPLADVFYGVDNTFLRRALDNDIFLPYDAPALADVPDALQLDSEHRALPVNYGDVCLNYDVAWFAERGLPPPDRPNYHNIRKLIHLACFLIFLALPFSNVMRFDIPKQCFYFFGVQLWISEFGIIFFAMM